MKIQNELCKNSMLKSHTQISIKYIFYSLYIIILFLVFINSIIYRNTNQLLFQ
jgi:hypothetical protein